MEGLELDRAAVLAALAHGRRLGCRLARLGFRAAATLRQYVAG